MKRVPISAVIVAGTYHPPLGVVVPGPVIDVARDISVSGAPVHRPRAALLPRIPTLSQIRPDLSRPGSEYALC